MRAVAALTLLLACRTAWASPQSLLSAALGGSRVPFEGVQTATVCTASGSAASEVAVFGDGKGSVRREYRTGAARGVVILQTPRGAWERAGGAWASLPAPFPVRPAQAAARVVRNYRVTVLPAARLLGRSVVPLRIDARHAFNPSRRIWLDASTGLVLKDEMYGPDGRLRSRTVFTRLLLRRQPASAFVPPKAAVSEAYGPGSFVADAGEREVERITGRAFLAPRYVPAGYVVEMVGHMRTRRGYTPAVRYSDGLSAFSVFQRGGPGMGGGMGRGRMGMMSACVSRSDNQQAVLMTQTVKARYLLVGDLAEAELRKVADSLP